MQCNDFSDPTTIINVTIKVFKVSRMALFLSLLPVGLLLVENEPTASKS